MQGHYIPSITSIAGPSPFALEALRGTSGGATMTTFGGARTLPPCSAHRLLSWGRSSQATGLRPFALPHPKRLSTSPDSPAVLAHNTLRPGSLPLRRPWPIGWGEALFTKASGFPSGLWPSLALIHKRRGTSELGSCPTASEFFGLWGSRSVWGALPSAGMIHANQL